MMHATAIQTIDMLRAEVVAACGAGGPEVSEINEILENLRKGDLDSQEAVLLASKVKERTKPISH